MTNVVLKQGWFLRANFGVFVHFSFAPGLLASAVEFPPGFVSDRNCWVSEIWWQL